jgi:hypothetical protein
MTRAPPRSRSRAPPVARPDSPRHRRRQRPANPLLPRGSERPGLARRVESVRPWPRPFARQPHRPRDRPYRHLAVPRSRYNDGVRPRPVHPCVPETDRGRRRHRRHRPRLARHRASHPEDRRLLAPRRSDFHRPHRPTRLRPDDAPPRHFPAASLARCSLLTHAVPGDARGIDCAFTVSTHGLVFFLLRPTKSGRTNRTRRFAHSSTFSLAMYVLEYNTQSRSRLVASTAVAVTVQG